MPPLYESKRSSLTKHYSKVGFLNTRTNHTSQLLAYSER
jgi:hypothetical protein